MDTIPLAILFRRFVDDGDIAAFEALFDRAAPEMMRVATRLVGDIASAEDLVQATFVAALTNARRFDVNRPLMPWLLGILAKQGSKARRDAARSGRAHHAELESISSAPNPERAAMADEARVAISSAIVGLPELYREVVRRVVLDGMKPGDVATDLSRSPGTVRIQLHRGLDLLRAALPPSLGGALVLAWPSRGHAAMKAAVLDEATRVAKAKLLFGGASLLAIGGLMSAKTWIAVMAAIVVVLGTANALRPRGEAGSPSNASSTAPTPPQIATDAPLLSSPAAADEQVRDAVPATVSTGESNSGPPGFYLVGRILGLGAHHPESAKLAIQLENRTASLNAPVEADGSFVVDLTSRFEAPPIRIVAVGSSIEASVPTTKEQDERPKRPWLDVTVRHPLVFAKTERWLPEEAFKTRAPDERIEIHRDFTPTLGATVTGQVALPAPNSDWEFQVGIFERAAFDRPEAEACMETRLESTGRFETMIDAEGEVLVVVSHPRLSAAVATGFARRGESIDVGTITLEKRGVSLSGILKVPAGISPRGSSIVLDPRASVPRGATPTNFDSLDRIGDRFERRIRSAMADANGRFEFVGIEPGKHEIAVEHVGGRYVPLQRSAIVEVTAPAKNVVLDDGSQLVTLVAERNGALLPGVSFVVEENGFEHRFLETGGEVGFLCTPEMDLHVVVNSPGRRSIEMDIPAKGRGEQTRRVADFSSAGETATLVLTTTSPMLHDDPSVRVVMTSLDDPSLQPINDKKRWTERRIVLDGLSPGRWKIQIASDDDATRLKASNIYAPEEFEVALIAGSPLTHEVALAPAGRLLVRFDGYSKDEFEMAGLEIESSDHVIVNRSIVIIGGGGYGRILGKFISIGYENIVEPDLVPGRYTLRITAKKSTFAERTIDVQPSVLTTTVFTK